MTARKQRKRRGIATSECALCLPMLVILTLGTIETCSAIFLKETVTIAAYEGARVGIQRGGSDKLVSSRVREFLDERGVKYDDRNVVTFSDPAYGITRKTSVTFDTADDLDHVTTTVTVPCDGNTFTGWYYTARSISASVTLRKEFGNARP